MSAPEQRARADRDGIRWEITWEIQAGDHTLHECRTPGCTNGCRGTRCSACWEKRLEELEGITARPGKPAGEDKWAPPTC